MEPLRAALDHLIELEKNGDIDSKKSDDEVIQNCQSQFDAFEALFERYLKDIDAATAEWDKVKTVNEVLLKPYDTLPLVEDATGTHEALNKLVVVKFNGDLGTSMGCVGPKSSIAVRSELNFIDLTIQQIEYLNEAWDVDVPLVLMNSFNTDEETESILKGRQRVRCSIFKFNQSRYPRIERSTLLPMARTLFREPEAWYPPGHGDFYGAFSNSGLLDQFIGMGKEVMFISNIDNLAATVDLQILHLFAAGRYEFLMELTEKTMADVKGGALVDYEDKLRLLETAQVPKEHLDEFKSVRKFRYFNTNNLWCCLKSVKRVIEEGNMVLDVIVNPKTLGNGLAALQLETAAGAAIKDFDNTLGVIVPRSRFLPVKTTSDLMLLMSNLYEMKGGSLSLSPLRTFPSIPVIKLGSSFKKVDDFLKRFESIPDLLELDHLSVIGDVTFGRNVSLKGSVLIIAQHGQRIDIPVGSILENKVITGYLRIMDH